MQYDKLDRKLPDLLYLEAVKPANKLEENEKLGLQHLLSPTYHGYQSLG